MGQPEIKIDALPQGQPPSPAGPDSDAAIQGASGRADVLKLLASPPGDGSWGLIDHGKPWGDGSWRIDNHDNGD